MRVCLLKTNVTSLKHFPFCFGLDSAENKNEKKTTIFFGPILQEFKTTS